MDLKSEIEETLVILMKTVSRVLRIGVNVVWNSGWSRRNGQKIVEDVRYDGLNGFQCAIEVSVRTNQLIALELEWAF